MLLFLLALLVILALFGAGFALHLLWWVAIIALVVWLVGFFMRRSLCAGRYAPVSPAISTARAVADTVTALDRTIARRMSSDSGARPSPSSGRASATPP